MMHHALQGLTLGRGSRSRRGLPMRLTVAVLAGAAAALYLRRGRRWQLTWGATDDEVARPLPGDDIVPHPTFNATRAVTIAAPPEAIWPWLLQVGVTRGGWYSYDLLDNLGHPSATRIIPEFQDLSVGDVIPISPDGKQGLRVHALDLPRSMVWSTPGVTSWAWVAEPRPDGTTRLITRVRSRYRWLSPSVAFSMLIEFGDVWMMRKMLLTLRSRIETARSDPGGASALPRHGQPARPGLSRRSRGLKLPPSVRAAARAAVFFLKVFPMLPARPVNWVTPRPVVERVTYPTSTGSAVGDLYRPAAGMAPGIVVCLGVVPFGVDHPQVARLGEALARSGFAALLYWSPAMRDLRLEPRDAQDLALAYGWLIDQPGVDAARSGLLGTCVGGSFALMAAADPAIRHGVAFVAAFAPYSSMWTFARDIASSTRSLGEHREPWAVDQLTRDVFVRSVTDQLDAGEQAAVRAAVAERRDLGVSDDLSPDARVVYRLLTAATLDETDAAIGALPERMREHLSSLSPLGVARDIRAPLIVLGHDRDDRVVPVSESRQLCEAFAGRPGLHYTEFALFQHATPRNLPVRSLAVELGKFYRYVYPLFRATMAEDQTTDDERGPVAAETAADLGPWVPPGVPR